MKTVQFIVIIFFLLMATGCEKAILDEEEEKTEIRNDNDNDNGNDNDDGKGNDDGNDDGEDDGSNLNDDRQTPYEEKDFVDGNEDHGGYQTGDELTVMEFIQADYLPGVWVTGYIVGACARSIENADFDAPFDWSSAILLADNPNERNVDRVISIELKSGSELRKTVNLDDHPEMKGRRLRIFGYRCTYLGIYGIKNVNSGNWQLLND